MCFFCIANSALHTKNVDQLIFLVTFKYVDIIGFFQILFLKYFSNIIQILYKTCFCFLISVQQIIPPT